MLRGCAFRYKTSATYGAEPVQVRPCLSADSARSLTVMAQLLTLARALPTARNTFDDSSSGCILRSAGGKVQTLGWSASFLILRERGGGGEVLFVFERCLVWYGMSRGA